MSNPGLFDREPSDTAADDPSSADASDLTDRERRILAFERQWWKLEGSKEQAVRDAFGLSPTRYYQLLNGLVDRPEALAFDPMTVKRLRRLRAARRRRRTARQLGIQL
ncbi:DUF3263 domain-containing protein [Nocardiopsis trehalosi]|jgi:hypothetical protein|uniref:DUF3263 domain-containing protein n=1 Tax=Nocardiopsis trehalosi TaxID=109329 RepID=UPI0009FC3774|nr:DUF3263 domain-containing protein [Nocardiopsis trehalosi]